MYYRYLNDKPIVFLCSRLEMKPYGNAMDDRSVMTRARIYMHLRICTKLYARLGGSKMSISH